MKVQNIVARWPGATHDQTLLSQSVIHDRIQDGNFGAYILVVAVHKRKCIRQQLFVLEMLWNGNMVSSKSDMAYGLRINVRPAQKILAIAAMLHNICIEQNELEAPRDHIVEKFLHRDADEEREI